MEELQTSFDELEREVNIAIEEIGETDDLKAARNRLMFVKEKVDAAILEDEPKNGLLDKITTGFEKINKRLEEYRENFEKECAENLEKFKTKFEKSLDFSKTSENFREAREKLVSLQNEIRNLTLKKEDKEKLSDKIQEAFIELSKRQDEERERYEMECSENYLRLKAVIDEAINFVKTTTNFREARQKLIEAQGLIKGKTLKRDKRDELYESIRTCFTALNEKQDSEREDFEKESEQNYERLSVIVSNAIEFAKTSEIYKDAREALIRAQKEIKGVRLKKVHRDELYGRIREIFNSVNEKQNKERQEFDSEANENFESLNEKVLIATEEAEIAPDFRIIRDKLISLQDEVKIMKLRREQRNDLYKKIRHAFSIFDHRRIEYREAMKLEKKDKLESVVNNLKAKLERLEEHLNEDIKSQKITEDQIENPEIKEEEKERLSVKLEEIKNRIAEKESSIEETNKRIEEVTKEIDSL